MILLPLSIIMGALVTSLNAIHLPSATVGMVIEQRSPWPMIAIGLKTKTIWHLFSKILMGFITVWNYRTRN